MIQKFKGISFFDFLTTFNGLQVPPGNLGIIRSQMPQIDGNKVHLYLAWLSREYGVKSRENNVSLSSLKIAQWEFNKFKVLKMMNLLKQKTIMRPILVTSDGFVLDGSHRFIAEYNLDKTSRIRAIIIDAPARHLIEISRKCPHVRFRNVSDTEIKRTN